ncbi:hypothetical protein ACX80D_03325 [Arthrobacter sp. Sr24]
MYTQSKHGHQRQAPPQHGVSRWAGAGAAILFLVVAIPAPAHARQDPGTLDGIVQVLPEHQCPLTRIGQQYVRCGALTGAGSAAPSWVPEQ